MVAKVETLLLHSKMKLHELSKDKRFVSHSKKRILDFYRQDALPHISSMHSRPIKALDKNSSIKDLMQHYVDIYDDFILHGNPNGRKMIPMNTGNPGFAPFVPIVETLQKSLLQENLSLFTKYEMQVPSEEFVHKLSQYCKEEQILDSNRTLNTRNVVLGNGSTNLYYLAVKSIVKNKGDMILITRPTYGLFIDPIFSAGARVGFLDISEATDWKVNPEVLAYTIHHYSQKIFYRYIINTFLKEYSRLFEFCKKVHSDEKLLPEVPNLELISNVSQFDEYINELNKYVEQLKIPITEKKGLMISFPPKIRGFYHINPHNPTGAIYSVQEIESLSKIFQGYQDIYIIEDLAHWGISYGKTVPFAFSAVEQNREKTVTLLSLSKTYCVPGLRAGIAIGPSNIIAEMQYRLLNSNSSASLPAKLAFEAVFSSPKTVREQYLQSNNSEYAFRCTLMAALINGIHNTNRSFSEKIKIYQIVLENEYIPGKPFDKKGLQALCTGIPLVRTITTPEGCFFHLLDVSRLIGAKILDKPLYTATGVRNALYRQCNIDTVPGELSGNFFNYTLRLSFSLSPKEIYLACNSLRQFINENIHKFNHDLKINNTLTGKAQFSTSINMTEGELLLDISIIYYYLNIGVHKLTDNFEKLFSSNCLQNRDRLQVLKRRILDLEKLLNKLLVTHQDAIIYDEIQEYLLKNQFWFQNTIPDFELLMAINREALKLAKEDRCPNRMHLRSSL